jgi:hypothetical protein
MLGCVIVLRFVWLVAAEVYPFSIMLRQFYRFELRAGPNWHESYAKFAQ